MAKLRVPPHNSDAEQSVLGAVLIDREAIHLISELIHPRDFYNEIHQIIFTAMLVLADERKPIDLVTLTSQLKKDKLYSKIDSAYLTELVNSVPTAANVEHYPHLIK